MNCQQRGTAQNVMYKTKTKNNEKQQVVRVICSGFMSDMKMTTSQTDRHFSFMELKKNKKCRW